MSDLVAHPKLAREVVDARGRREREPRLKPLGFAQLAPGLLVSALPRKQLCVGEVSARAPRMNPDPLLDHAFRVRVRGTLRGARINRAARESDSNRHRNQGDRNCGDCTTANP